MWRRSRKELGKENHGGEKNPTLLTVCVFYIKHKMYSTLRKNPLKNCQGQQSELTSSSEDRWGVCGLAYLNLGRISSVPPIEVVCCVVCCWYLVVKWWYCREVQTYPMHAEDGGCDEVIELLIFIVKKKRIIWLLIISSLPQKFGHWYRHPEFPRRLGSQPAAAGLGGLGVEVLLVWKDACVCQTTQQLNTHSSDCAASWRSVFPSQVWPVERHGGACCWVTGRPRCRYGRTSVAVCAGICCRGDGLWCHRPPGRWHHTRGSSQVKKEDV